jgi:hypothetical protein
LVYGGEIDLENTLFESNYDGSNNGATSGIGVVNLGGQVQCDVAGCLPVCTKCEDDPHPPPPAEKKSVTNIPEGVVAISALFLLVLGGVLILRGKLNVTSVSSGGYELPDTSNILCRTLLDDSAVRNPPEEVHVSMALLQSSRAAIFVVDHAMRVELWSTGNR